LNNSNKASSFIFWKLSETAQAVEMQANFQQKIMPFLKNEPDRTARFAGASARRASGAVSGRVLVPSGSAPPIHFLIPRHLSSPRSGEVFGRGWNKTVSVP